MTFKYLMRHVNLVSGYVPIVLLDQQIVVRVIIVLFVGLGFVPIVLLDQQIVVE